MSEGTSHHDPLDLKKNGCRKWAIILLLLLILTIPILSRRLMPTNVPIQTSTVLKDLAYAISAFELDSAHFPIPESDWNGPDVSLRTRGRIVPALLGNDTSLNPKNIKFIDYPEAKDHKDGLWQDGTEWVLSDRWGEPYYVVLDTNKDTEIANPEFEEDPSDPAQVKRHQENPPPKMLPKRVLIYSSGPDRDAKTWKDNICSWRTR